MKLGSSSVGAIVDVGEDTSNEYLCARLMRFLQKSDVVDQI